MSEAPNPTPASTSGLRNEAIVLAASSAAAYLVALSYESGYAAHFQYPRYLIEVGFSVALTAWAAILGFGALLIAFITQVAYFVPASASIALFKATYPALTFATLGIAISQVLPGVLGLIVGAFFLCFSGMSLIAISRETRRRPQGQLKADFWHALAESRIRNESRLVQESLIDRVVAAPKLGRLAAWVWIIVICGVIAGGTARMLGSGSARQQADFLVIRDSLDYVVVKRFPTYLVSALLVHPNTIGTCFRVFPLPPTGSLSMEWRHIGLLRIIPHDTEPRPGTQCP